MITTSDVQILKSIDNISDILESNDNLSNGSSLAAEVSKLIAMIAAGAAAEALFSTYSALEGFGYKLSQWSMGMAISGREADISRTKALTGLVVSQLVGEGIDWVNGQNLGVKIYDWTHPDQVGIEMHKISFPLGDSNGNSIPDIQEGIWQSNVSATFTSAATAIRRDPLTIDLDGDGIESSGLSTVMFDQTGHGVKTVTGWIKPDDGLLVLDRNGNGTIDNGLELFGDSTRMSNGQLAKNGFEALADLDTNHDGVIDANDAQFANLRIWQDLNQDGISQANELFTLTEKGILSLNVTSTNNLQSLTNGNELANLGVFTKLDGTAGVLGSLADVNLTQDTFHILDRHAFCYLLINRLNILR